jgi:hypothetical protein
MHTAPTAHETLMLLWDNYLTLCKQVDFDSMTPEVRIAHIEQNTPFRPFRIASWLARQGFFVTSQ